MKTAVIIFLFLTNNEIDSKPAAKVIGGEVVESIESFPYQTAIFINKETSTAFCSGSILSSNYILTCAHCLTNSDSASVFYGSEKLSALDFSKSQVVNSSNYRIHPEFTTFVNDIALIELPKAIEFTDLVRPISLPTAADVLNEYVDQQMMMASWGSYSNELTISDELRYATMKIVSSKECSKVFGPLITDSVICSYEMHCSGDSGSLLVDGNVAVGIATFSMGSCEEGKSFPSVFVKVASYLDFIKDNSNLVVH